MTSRDYVEMARSMGQDEVRALWGRIKSGQTLDAWPSGMAFEHLLLRQFEIEGAKVVWPFEVQLQGMTVEQIDGAVYVDGIPFLIEAKDHATRVDFEPVARLATKLQRRPPSTLGMVFARHGFTDSARTLAQYSSPVRILLWGSLDTDSGIMQGVMVQYLRRKYELAIERAMPDLVASLEDQS